MTFEVGDKAVVPSHGVGIVKEISSVEVDGVPYEMYVIKILDNGLTYSVPIDKPRRERHPRGHPGRGGREGLRGPARPGHAGGQADLEPSVP